MVVEDLLVLATIIGSPLIPPLERAALVVRIEERNRPEPPAEVPAGDDTLEGIVERFHSMPYEEFYASLSEEERRRYLRQRYRRDVQIRLVEGEEIYFLTGFYWER
ncbi:MAG: hypothetical protein NZ749_05420 [bacterium]|nr:hypothetical protein [bacterium]